VLERRFDWSKRSHRRALLEDELELPDLPAVREMQRIQAAYRRNVGFSQSTATDLARSFRNLGLRLVSPNGEVVDADYQARVDGPEGGGCRVPGSAVEGDTKAGARSRRWPLPHLR
jgi:hypothetical protein